MDRRLHGFTLSQWRFALYIGTTLVWLRYGDRVVALQRGPLTFSERNGYRPYRLLPFGWRIINVL